VEVLPLVVATDRQWATKATRKQQEVLVAVVVEGTVAPVQATLSKDLAGMHRKPVASPSQETPLSSSSRVILLL
jgi:hypothetical protein